MRVCVVVPIYNEEAILRVGIETILAYTRKLPPVVTLLAVDDGSSDATNDILNDFALHYPKSEFQVLSHPQNRGYGAALRSGIKFAAENNYNYTLFMDSDLTNHPRYLEIFYKKMEEGWDYIKATRYAPGGGACGTRGVPLGRRFISRAGNLFARAVTRLPLSDITNGFRAVKTDILKKLELKEDHFSIIVEELMKARKLTSRFTEIPHILEARGKNAPPTKFRYDFVTFWKYFSYLFS